jgi:hypothetical protein
MLWEMQSLCSGLKLSNPKPDSKIAAPQSLMEKNTTILFVILN